MKLKHADLKVLWGRSGGRCAICKEGLFFKDSTGRNFGDGKQAHMYGRSERGPRGKGKIANRDEISNILVLCPGCHNKIDLAPDDWPVERLRQVKEEHEKWVEELGIKAPSITEFEGIVTVSVGKARIVEGVVTTVPTRFKAGTSINVSATQAEDVTGLRIGERRE